MADLNGAQRGEDIYVHTYIRTVSVTTSVEIYDRHAQVNAANINIPATSTAHIKTTPRTCVCVCVDFEEKNPGLCVCLAYAK